VRRACVYSYVRDPPAISEDSLVFLAGFSQANDSRATSYRIEGLTQAIEQLRLRPLTETPARTPRRPTA